MNRRDSSPGSSQSTRPFLVIRTCKHILENGAPCQAAAVGGSTYCRAHLSLRARGLKMARASRAASHVELLPLMDMKSIQVNVARVKVALEAGHLDQERARLLRWGLRQAATNLRYMERMKEVQTSRMETKPELPQARKSKRLYHMPITVINSTTSKRNTW